MQTIIIIILIDYNAVLGDRHDDYDRVIVFFVVCENQQRKMKGWKECIQIVCELLP